MSQIGLIGLAVMGQNFVRNFASKDIDVSVYNRTESVTKEFSESFPQEKIHPYYDLKSFVESLEKPRKIILLVKSGPAVDAVINSLLPLVEQNDIIIDSGNSYFEDTTRRYQELSKKGLHYVGMGISGGEEGALYGPSLMPGGDKEVVERELLPLLKKVAAPTPTPCVAYMGRESAGHYVKMVHNGIEYSDMQLISEIYWIAKHLLNFSNKEIGCQFAKWNETDLQSYLVEITHNILHHNEDGISLVDIILDQASGKGTGLWTSIESLKLGIPTPSITASLQARQISSSDFLRSIKTEQQGKPQSISIDELESAMRASKILSYAQGMHLLHEASERYNLGLDLSLVAEVWRDGCIIRSTLLDTISKAYKAKIAHLLEDDIFSAMVSSSIPALRKVVSACILSGLPCYGLSSTLWYYDSITNEKLPANLIQAQRDYFGAHTYKRVDKDGSFHTEWTKSQE